MTRVERFARWLHAEYGRYGRQKPVWAWLLECVMLRCRPRRDQRRMFLGAAPEVDEVWPR